MSVVYDTLAKQMVWMRQKAELDTGITASSSIIEKNLIRVNSDLITFITTKGGHSTLNCLVSQLLQLFSLGLHQLRSPILNHDNFTCWQSLSLKYDKLWNLRSVKCEISRIPYLWGEGFHLHVVQYYNMELAYT